MKTKTKLGSKIFIAIMLLFFYLPIFYTVLFSFNSSKSLTNFTGFSLQWYIRMFNEATMIEALFFTITIAILATIISTIVGTITCIGISKSNRILKYIIKSLNNFPVLNPDIVTGIGLLMLFSTFKIEKGFATMLIAHIMFCIPYVMLSVMPKLRQMNPNIIDAALDLGATPMQTITKVIIPEIMPGIVSGALIAFTMSIDDFIISYFVTGGGVNNISILVYTMARRINPSVNAISTIMILIVTVILVLLNIIQANSQKPASEKKNTKPLFVVLGLIIVAIIVPLGNSKLKGSSAIEKYGTDTLKIFNWGEYVGENTIKNFEEEFGVKVIYENFDSNEMMYTKLQAGDQYDVLVPSDYMIEKLIAEDYLMEIDKSYIPNFDNLEESLKGLPYDPENKYSIPYFWGTVGIVYNKNNVDYEDLEKYGYNIFKQEKYKGKIYMYDSERDSFMIALKSLGYSMNTTNIDEINEAYEWLRELNETMEPIYVVDEVIDNMVNGLKDMAIVYSGDAAYILSENEDMGFYMPKEGTNLWSDAMVVPKTCQCPELAFEFINYILSYEASYDNSSYVGYTSSNKDVIRDLSSEDGDYYENEAYLPRTGYENDEVFRDNKEVKQLISELWIKVKANN